MTLHCTSIDRDSLPAAMLDIAKAHVRVQHTRDDTLVLQYIAQAIEQIERRCSINVNPASYELTLDALGCSPCATPPGAVRARLPINNVATFTVLDADAVDLSADYAIEQADIGGAFAAYLVGAPLAAPGASMLADVGVTFVGAGSTTQPDLAPMAPAIAAAVLRLVGGYYEAREAGVAITVDEFAPELVALWNPSA